MIIALFTHNLVHKKTQDFLWRLIPEGFSPKVVLACNPIELDAKFSKLSDDSLVDLSLRLSEI